MTSLEKKSVKRLISSLTLLGYSLSLARALIIPVAQALTASLSDTADVFETPSLGKLQVILTSTLVYEAGNKNTGPVGTASRIRHTDMKSLTVYA